MYALFTPYPYVVHVNTEHTISVFSSDDVVAITRHVQDTISKFATNVDYTIDVNNSETGEVYFSRSVEHYNGGRTIHVIETDFWKEYFN